jgi:Tfp pilus assembly protein PilZ
MREDMSVAATQKTGSPEERRRHVRQKTHVLTCVKLENDNGGILLNLGTGGLSFQAVSQLDQDRDLVLHFKLPDSAEEIQLEGSVAWLGPTRKDAGICFRDLPDRTQQRISEWIEKQGPPSDAKELKAAPPVKLSPKASERPVLPPRPGIKPILPRLPVPTRDLNPSLVVPSGSASRSALPSFDARRPIAPAALAASSLPPIPTPPIQPGRQSDAVIAKSQTCSSEPEQTFFPPKLPGPFERSQEISREVGASPAFPELPPSTLAAVKNWWFRPVLVLSPAAEGVKRPKLMVAGLASCVLLLGLIVASPDYGRYLEQIHTNVSSMLNSSPPKATAPDPSAAGTSLQSQERTMASPPAPSDSLSTPAPVTAPSNFARMGSKAAWLSVLKKIFPNIKNSSAYDQALAGIQVWTHQHSGYYYCTDSPYFEKLVPGSLMTQGDALQSGYQPKLGSYCE